MGIPRVQNPAHSALRKPRESPTPPTLNLAVAIAYRFRKFPLQVGMPWRVYVVTPVERQVRPGLRPLGFQENLADTGRNEPGAVAIPSPKWKLL